jgi:predicted nuclease of predicted toxin-antitoxin system
MRLLPDQGLPRSAGDLLRALGHVAAHVGDIGLADAEDAAILEHAIAHRDVVVTLDADFHAIIAVSGASAPSVIRLRIEGLRASELVDALAPVVEQCADQLEKGALVTIDERRVRVRLLPVSPDSRRGPPRK